MILIVLTIILMVNFVLITNGEKFYTTIFKCADSADNESDIGSDVLQVVDPDVGLLQTYTFKLENSSEDLKCPAKDRFLYSIEQPLLTRFITPGGLLSVGADQFVIYRDVTNYCVHSIVDTVILSVCNLEPGEGSMLIQKCCFSPNQLLGYDAKNRISCQYRNRGHEWHWAPSMMDNLFSYFPYEKLNLSSRSNYYGSLQNFLSDDDGDFFSVIQPVGNFSGKYNPNILPGYLQIYKNEGFAVCNSSVWTVYEPENQNLCVDAIQNFGQNSSRASVDISIAILSTFNATDLISVLENMQSVKDLYASSLLHLPTFVSLIFLFMTILVYILVWEKQNGYSYTVLSYILSQFMSSVIGFISFIVGGKNSMATSTCKYLAIASHFFFLSKFFWLTAICFDIYWTFRKTRSSSNIFAKKLKRFLIYTAICWTIPAVFVAVGLSVTSAWDSDLQGLESECSRESAKIKPFVPRYGEMVCDVSFEALGLYKYFPVGISIGFNVIVFGLTLCTLYKRQKTINESLKDSSHRNQSITRIFGKLFFVMGISWCTEFIVWFILYKYSYDGDFVVVKAHSRNRLMNYTIVAYFALMGRILQLLQNIVIFYIFVCKKHIYVQLWKKHLWLRPILFNISKLCCCNSDVSTTNTATTSNKQTSK